MRTAFITGSTGFLGLNLIEELLDRGGWRLVALHRPSSNLEYLGRFDVERAEGDITDLDSLRRAIPDGTDAVFHTAANTNMWSPGNEVQTRENVDGTRNVIDAAIDREARRLVHTSSIAAYGPQDGTIDESVPQLGASSWVNYVRTKALSEDEVRRGIARGLDAVVLNPANIMGRYDLQNWSTMIYLAHRRRLRFAPPGIGSFCHAREVARAHVDAVDRGRTGENYLLGGADASYAELLQVIGEVSSAPVPSRTIPAWLLRAMARAASLRSRWTGKRPLLTPEAAALACARMTCRSGKAVDELGYRSTSLEQMVRDCYDWMKEERRLG
jgi:nucleoside-diphosphate-sugar epimerase